MHIEPTVKLRANIMIGRASSSTARFAATVLGVSLVLFALGNNWTDFGFPSFVTANRLAYAILLFAAAGLLSLQKPRILRIPFPVRLLVLVAVVLGLWGALSFLLSPAREAVSLERVLVWFILGSVMVVSTPLAKAALPEASPRLVNTLLLGAALVAALTLVWVLQHVPLGDLSGFNWWGVRRMIDDNISVGLNRYLNGLFLLSIVPTAVVLGVISRRGPVRALGWFTVAIFVTLFLVGGSRQNLTAWMLFVVVLLMSAGSLSRRKAIARKIGTFRLRRVWLRILLLGIMVGILVWKVPGVWEWVNRRIITTTQTQFTQEAFGRVEIYRGAVRVIAEYPILGVGPGAYHHVLASYPHNGYLGLASELGLPPLLLVVSMLLLTLVWTYRRQPVVASGEIHGLFSAVWAYVVVWIVWSVNLNDLLNEPVLWAYIALLAATTTVKRSSRDHAFGLSQPRGGR
jgi:O-antigen ligase